MAYFESIGMKAYFLPKNECGYIGSERKLKGTERIKVFKSFCGGSFRFILYKNNEPISVLQIMFDGSVYQIANVYTEPNHQRKGHAKELFYFAKNKLKSKIFHSGNLSELGKKFAQNVN